MQDFACKIKKNFGVYTSTHMVEEGDPSIPACTHGQHVRPCAYCSYNIVNNWPWI